MGYACFTLRGNNKVWIYTAEFVAGGVVSTGWAVGLFAYMSQGFPPDNPVMFGVLCGFLRLVGDIFLTAAK